MYAHVLLLKCFPGLFLMRLLSPTVTANIEKFGATSSLSSCCVFEICQLRCGSSYNQCWHLISTVVIIQLALLGKSLMYVYLFIYSSFTSYKWDYTLTKSCWNKYKRRTSAWISKLQVWQLHLWHCRKWWDRYKNNRGCLNVWALEAGWTTVWFLYSWGFVWARFLLCASEHNSLCD